MNWIQSWSFLYTEVSIKKTADPASLRTIIPTKSATGLRGKVRVGVFCVVNSVINNQISSFIKNR